MKRYFVLGSEIKYTLSPKIYNLLFDRYKIRAEYTVKDIKTDELKFFIESLGGYDGFNVTKPFKKEIIKYLKSDKSECESVNTVTASDMAGYSTDGEGFIYDLERKFSGASASRLLVIGYGGAASACVNALKKRGATIYVTGRNADKAQEFANSMGIEVFKGEKTSGIISCVTETYIPKTAFKQEFCYDIRYSGEILNLNCPTSDGLGMLIAQAIFSFAIFMGKRFDKSEADKLYLFLKERL